MIDEDRLERAREELKRASDAADGELQTHLDSLQEGVAEELEGHRTQDDPGPKADNIREIADKLDGLLEETTGETRERIARAREQCLESLDRSR